MLDTLACGATFGAALAASGVHQPDVIVSQLTLEDFHMLESFLTAVASSAYVNPPPPPLSLTLDIFCRLRPASRETIG